MTSPAKGLRWKPSCLSWWISIFGITVYLHNRELIFQLFWIVTGRRCILSLSPKSQVCQRGLGLEVLLCRLQIRLSWMWWSTKGFQAERWQGEEVPICITCQGRCLPCKPTPPICCHIFTHHHTAWFTEQSEKQIIILYVHSEKKINKC